METVLYGVFFVCWLFWCAERAAKKVDVSLGLVIGAVATCFMLRVGWILIEALRVIQASWS